MDLSSMTEDERRRALWEALGMSGMPMPEPAVPAGEVAPEPVPPDDTDWCPGCWRPIPIDVTICPHCGAELRPPNN